MDNQQFPNRQTSTTDPADTYSQNESLTPKGLVRDSVLRDPSLVNASMTRPRVNSTVKADETTAVQAYALVGGLLMVALGIWALAVPGVINDNLPTLSINNSYSWFMGNVPLNIVNKFMLIAYGIAGMAVSKRIDLSVNWSRFVFITMGIFAVMGLFPQTNTLFGLAPLFSTSIIVHGIFAIFGGIFASSGMKSLKT